MAPITLGALEKLTALFRFTNVCSVVHRAQDDNIPGASPHLVKDSAWIGREEYFV
jgi:hypothetical protein